MRILAVPACLLVMAAPSLHSQAAPTTKPATLQWGPAPAVFPKGATMAVVSGDPGKAAPFTVELAMPAGAHHFAAAQGATVIAVSAMGPFGMTYVNSADDPQKQAAKP